jgi:uncharacterized damage-inducible protein DinB
MIGVSPRFTTRWWQSEDRTEGVSLETTNGSAQTVGDEFVDASRVFLRQDFLPKLLHCLNAMTDDQIWWRPNEQSNSVGNLVLHLCGNLKQWIVASLGGQTFQRERDAEFATRTKVSRAELISAIETAVAEVESVLLNFPTDQLLVQYPVQVYQVSALQAVYHVVEHFSYHLGQILYIYKLQTATDPGFYRQLTGQV